MCLIPIDKLESYQITHTANCFTWLQLCTFLQSVTQVLLFLDLQRAAYLKSNINKYMFFPQQVYPCSNDKECSVGSYCHSPQHSPSRCLTCRRRKKRCNRDAMCCPGNRCSNCTYLTHKQSFQLGYIVIAGYDSEI